MNRREFLRGGLIAGFTALLAKLGLAKAEEASRVRSTGQWDDLGGYTVPPDVSNRIQAFFAECEGVDRIDLVSTAHTPLSVYDEWGVPIPFGSAGSDCVDVTNPKEITITGFYDDTAENREGWQALMRACQSVMIPVLHPDGGFGRATIDRDLWNEDDVLTSLHRQIARSRDLGEDVPYWMLEVTGLEPHHGVKNVVTG